MKIVVIGQGYVGLPLALTFAEAGHEVLGVDIDKERIRTLHARVSPFRHVATERLRKAKTYLPVYIADDVAGGVPTLLGDANADAYIVCVPTPLGNHNEPDLKPIKAAASWLATQTLAHRIVVLESTSYPGTTEEVLGREIKLKTAQRGGEDYALAFSPEREDPGWASESGAAGWNTVNTPKLVGGVNPASTSRAAALYSTAFQTVVAVSSARVAEAAKLLENIYRAVNIGLVNEMKMLLDFMGIDISEVIAAASTKPFGFKAFQPGPGIGGHCIPLDPHYFRWAAEGTGQRAKFVELASEINSFMPSFVVGKLIDGLNEKQLCVNGARILLLGAAYKAHIDDDRESPTYALADILDQLHARVEICDPWVKNPALIKHEVIPDHYDAIVLMTNHDNFSVAAFWQYVNLERVVVVDTRNALPWITNRIKA